MMDDLQYDPLSHIFEDADFGDDDHLLSILDSLDDDIISPSCTRSNKRQKISSSEDNVDGQPKVSHITVERNRRRQMNHQISILRSLMPTFYVKRGDQASVIGGVVDYINELQQLVQSLEAKKQRKILYTEVVSPRGPIPSPGPSPSPRPGTPQTGSGSGSYLTNSLMSVSHCYVEPSPTSSSSASSCGSINVNVNDDGIINELTANSKSPIAEVEVRFSGPHLLLKTQSPPIPGQALKIIAALHHFPLEILHLTVTTAHQTMLNSFTIKIGIECQLSAQDLAQQVQQTFCQPY